MRTLAVIPARLGATRLPRKPLRLLAGQPLIVRVWEHVQAMDVVDQIVVATDSGEIASIVAQAGGTVAITRADHPSGTDRVAEVVFGIAGDQAGFDVIVNVQGDEPFIPPEAVRGARDMVAQHGFELGTAAARADAAVLDDPDIVKVVCAKDGRALYFSRAPIPYLRNASDSATREQLVRQHIGVYAYTRDALQRWVALPPHALEQSERLEQLRPLAAGMTMGVALIDVRPPLSVDTEEDLMRANALWETRFAGRS
ncbi:MAG TPA: 3-deoxy-manno-octulosonate cytidylyltransferase [Gemmatimonadaceae bacterium]|nr:3-deoxy-manno-octulosonate cytidylyltransferase [Gemmatimonadaceae bacterium]